MKKIKVLYIITLSELGGAQKHLFYLFKYLNRELFTPVLVSGQVGWLMDEAAKLNIETFHCFNLVRQISPIKELKAILELQKIISSVKPDIIHCHSSKAGILGRIAARICNIPIILFTVHGWAFTEGVKSKTRVLYENIERHVAKMTTKIITVSDYDYNLAINQRVATKEKMITIKNGIDFSYHTDDIETKHKYRAHLGIDSSCAVITMVSRLSPQKDSLTFINLARLNIDRDTLFLLVGDGPQRKDIENIILENNIRNAILMGDREDVEDILQASDIFCFFSNWEGLPLAVIEAMAAGLPIIANPVGGVPELVKNEINGFLVDKNDINMVNSKLHLLLNDSSLKSKMSMASKEIYSNFFSAKRMVQQTEDLYCELVNSRTSK